MEATRRYNTDIPFVHLSTNKVYGDAPNEIKMNDVMHRLEGNIATVECVDNDDYCSRSADCAAKYLWIEVEQAIDKVLGSITLQDLVEKANEENKLNYQI